MAHSNLFQHKSTCIHFTAQLCWTHFSEEVIGSRLFLPPGIFSFFTDSLKFESKTIHHIITLQFNHLGCHFGFSFIVSSAFLSKHLRGCKDLGFILVCFVFALSTMLCALLVK